MMLSVTATLFNNHVLMMTQGQIIILIVQHGEWAETRWHTGWTRHPSWVVMQQEALKNI